MRSRSFAIRPQSVKGKAHAPGARMSPGGASVCQKTFEASYFTPKPSQFSCHCEAAARPWQSESRRYGLPWRSTGARNEKKSLSQKTRIHCIVLLPPSSFQCFVSFRSTIFRYGMTNRSVKDCRVGRKIAPSSQ